MFAQRSLVRIMPRGLAAPLALVALLALLAGMAYAFTSKAIAAPQNAYVSNPAPGSTINVGTATVGATISTTLTITNTGGITLTGDLAITGPNANNFRVAPNVINVPAGGRQTVTIGCTPSAEGARTATLTVYVTPNVTYPLTCTGTSYGSNPTPGSTINVGSVKVGTTITSTLTITRTGTGILTGTLAITGTNAADFRVTPTTFNLSGSTTTQTVAITCTPAAAGARTATLIVTHSGSGSPVTYTLTCTGTGPTLTVTGPSTGAPGSFFTFSGGGFTPGQVLEIRVDNKVVGRVQANADGFVSLAIEFRVFTLSAAQNLRANAVANHTVSVNLPGSTTPLAQATVTVDTTASKLARPTNVPIFLSQPALFLPIIGIAP